MLSVVSMLPECGTVTDIQPGTRDAESPARRGTGGTPAGAATWRDAVKAYLRDADVSGPTRAEYGKALRLFFGWCDSTGRNVPGLGREDIVVYKGHLTGPERRLSAQTVSLYLAAIKGFYGWAEAAKLFPNIAAGVRAPNVRKTFVKQHLTPAECGELLQKLADDVDGKVRGRTYGNARPNGLRDLAVVNLLLRTGMRTVEASRADIGDISLMRGRTVIMVQGKGHVSKDEFIPLSAKAKEALDGYLATRPTARPSEPLFICEGYGSRGRRLSERRIQEIVKEAIRSIGIDDHAYSAHSLRHTCAVILLESGVDPYDVQKFMRHRSIDTTEIYLESIEEERRLGREAEKRIDNAV